MATNVNLGQSVWNADDLINPVAIIFCVVISVKGEFNLEKYMA